MARVLQEELQTELTKKHQDLRDLNRELAQKDEELHNIRQRWKSAAKELGKYKAQGKAVDQVIDSELIQKARLIQYNIRNFTYQHFSDELNTGRSFEAFSQHLQKNLELSPDVFDACIHSSVKRPMLVAAFLWDFLMNDIFGRFWWGGRRVHYGMENLTHVFKSKLLYVVSHRLALMT